MTARDLAYQVTKYQQREGWSHKDLLRLSHPKTNDPAVAGVLKYVVKGISGELLASLGDKDVEGYLWAVEYAKKAQTAQEIVNLIERWQLPRECIPTQWLKDKAVWEALLQKMPLTAMIRNLATMSRVGLLVPFSDAVKIVTGSLRNEEKLRRARVHPIQLLSALRVYGKGGKVDPYSYYTLGHKTSRSQGGEFEVIGAIKDALNEAFYLSFGYVESAGKRTLLGLDISSSMDGGVIAGVPGLSPREASAAMAMVTARTEPQSHAVAFTTQISQFTLSKTDTIEQTVDRMRKMRMGGTDCAQPILWALDRKLPVDTFIIYTDGETWAGAIHPKEALVRYQNKMGIKSKLVVVAMTSTGFSLADPRNPDMLDVVGFDTATPNLIAEFSKGNI